MLSRRPPEWLDLSTLNTLRLLQVRAFNALRRAPIFLCLALLTAWLLSGLLYFDFSPKGFNTRRVTLVLAGLGICLVFCCFRQFRRSIGCRLQMIHPGARWLVFIALLLGLASSFMAQYPGKGLHEVGLYLLLMVMTLAVSVSGLNEKSIIALLWLCTAGLAIYSFGYLFNYALYLEYPQISWSHSLYKYSNPRNFNHAQGWLIPLLVLLPLACRNASGLLQRLSRFPLVALYFFMLVSAGKGLPLALFTAMVITAFLFRSYAQPQWGIQIRAFMVAAVFYVTFIHAVPMLLGLGYEDSNLLHRIIFYTDAGRLHFWELALKAAFEHPWLGLGPQHYITLDQVFLTSPHNVLLLWLSEWGVPAATAISGLLMWGIVAYVSGVRCYLTSNDKGLLASHTRIALFASLLTSCLYALISAVLITPLSQLLMVLVAGSCCHFHFQGRSASYPLTTIERSGWLLMAGAVLLIFFWIFFREWWFDPYPLSIPLESNSPRFWRNGDFSN